MLAGGTRCGLALLAGLTGPAGVSGIAGISRLSSLAGLSGLSGVTGLSSLAGFPRLTSIARLPCLSCLPGLALRSSRPGLSGLVHAPVEEQRCSEHSYASKGFHPILLVLSVGWLSTQGATVREVCGGLSAGESSGAQMPPFGDLMKGAHIECKICVDRSLGLGFAMIAEYPLYPMPQ